VTVCSYRGTPMIIASCQLVTVTGVLSEWTAYIYFNRRQPVVLLILKINLFIPSKHDNIYNHQHPTMATCFRPYLTILRAAFVCKRYYQCAHDLHRQPQITLKRVCKWQSVLTTVYLISDFVSPHGTLLDILRVGGGGGHIEGIVCSPIVP
jgi:hypothetical protein